MAGWLALPSKLAKSAKPPPPAPADAATEVKLMVKVTVGFTFSRCVGQWRDNKLSLSVVPACVGHCWISHSTQMSKLSHKEVHEPTY